MQITIDLPNNVLEQLSQMIIDGLGRKSKDSVFLQEKTNWLTHSEAATFIKKTKAALYKLTSERKIKYSKRGKQNYYRKEDLENYLENGLVLTAEEINKNISLMPSNKVKKNNLF